MIKIINGVGKYSLLYLIIISILYTISDYSHKIKVPSLVQNNNIKTKKLAVNKTIAYEPKQHITANKKETEEKSVNKDILFYEQLLYPVVRVSVEISPNDGWTGSAVVISSDRDGTYLLTASHVVVNTQYDDIDGILETAVENIKLHFFDYENYGDMTIRTANVISYDILRDIALIKTDSKPLVHSALLYRSIEEFRKAVRIGDKICAVGAGLGSVPTPSLGFWAAPSTESWPIWAEISAPIIFGNSGGSAFNLEDNKFCGITVAGYATYGMIVPHKALVTPFNQIFSWLQLLRETNGEVDVLCEKLFDPN